MRVPCSCALNHLSDTEHILANSKTVLKLHPSMVTEVNQVTVLVTVSSPPAQQGVVQAASIRILLNDVQVPVHDTQVARLQQHM